MDDLALKYSASLVYYTVFSVAPPLLPVISLAGIFFSKDAFQGKLFAEISRIVGAGHWRHNSIGRNTGIHQPDLTGQAKTESSPDKIGEDHLWSGSMIVTLGFLLLVSLLLKRALLALSDKQKSFFPGITVFIFNLISLVVSFLVIAVLLAVIFKVLPGAKMR